MRKMELAILKHIALISCFLTLTKTAEEPTTFIKWKKMNVSTPIFKDWLNKAMLIAGVNNMHVKNLTEVYMGKETPTNATLLKMKFFGMEEQKCEINWTDQSYDNDDILVQVFRCTSIDGVTKDVPADSFDPFEY